MTQINNLNTLAEQIYKEGIEKANEESSEILSKAHVEASKLLEEAEIKSAEIIRKAETEAEKFKSSTVNEIKLKAKQAVVDLKEEIISKLLKDNLEESIKKGFNEDDFIKELILKSTENWSKSEELNLLISEDSKKRIAAFLNNELKKKLPGTTVKIHNKLTKGFIIEHKKEGYFISFTDEDFIEFLKPYFSEKIREFLFDTDS